MTEESNNRISLEDNSSLLPTETSKMSEGQGTTESATQDNKGGAQPQDECQDGQEVAQEKSSGGEALGHFASVEY
jgi:hypothetical protein